ncbi:Long chain acyl-CoA synthetase 4 [Sesamum angolense]|uniref:Long chain acyl-CoA synthetase 4 n=1 Tax=Sesamum angolense TaxID=2727404 RepID=A0AAE1VY26_9LAMI|nr:Long chain acyl-CoA synthetase 4 [Sesamum angolense]
MAKERYIVEVERGKPAKDGKPSVGPVYRSKFAKDGFPEPIPGLDSCWDIFRGSQRFCCLLSVKYGVELTELRGGFGFVLKRVLKYSAFFVVEKYPNNRMLGRREIVDGKPGKYSWMTYTEVYDIVLKVGNSIRSCGIEEGGRCGIYGANSPEWIMSMEACNAHGLYCVPLYDTLGAGAVEFIICHAEVALAFVEEKKVSELLKTFPGATKCLRTIVSFGKVTSQQRDEVQKFGVTIYSWDEFLSLDVKLLVEDIGELKPTIFCAVPRVLDRIYSGLQQKISSGGFIKHTMFNLAYSLKLRSMKKGHKHAEASPLCDKIVFSKVKQGLGGKVRLILSGAAPLASHVEEFLRVVSGSYVLQGYGLTETCAGTFVSIPDELSMLGTVGPPVPNVDVCLESVPEMGYDALSSTPRGEVCVRGDTLFSGYYKRDDLTKEVFVDGWFHTGDIGEWQENGSLKIIDRKKNIFKLSQGEYVAVENLENIYGLVPAIESIWVYGNSFESFLVAIINPNKQVLEQWAEEMVYLGTSMPYLKGFEFIKAVHLDPVPFDMERDLITPTFKKKRPQLLKYYQGVIDNMYKSGK